MEDLVRGAEDVEEAREEALGQPQHVDGRTHNVEDASKDPVVEVQMRQVTMAHKGTLVDEGNGREKSQHDEKGPSKDPILGFIKFVPKRNNKDGS